MMNKSDFIPNSFQHPNAYVDQLMSYLTGDEFKVLTYLARRIFGFRKQTDRVAMSQLVNGITSKDGQPLDKGTGLTRPQVARALDCLIAFNIVIQVNPNDAHKNEGPEYALQLDSEAVEWLMLITRKDAQREKSKAQAARFKKLPPIYGGDEQTEATHTPLSHREGGAHTENNPPSHTENNPPSHGENTQYPVLNPGKSRERRGTARDPRLDHPAIKLVRETLRRYPDKGAWDSIIEALGEDPDGERFKQVYATWTLRGFKPTNLEGLLNWYKNGIPEYTGKYSAPVQGREEYKYFYAEE